LSAHFVTTDVLLSISAPLQPHNLNLLGRSCTGLYSFISESIGSGKLSPVEPAYPVAAQVPRDYATIQLALDAAKPLTTVLVSPGTYDERIHITKDVHVLSLRGPVATVIGYGCEMGIPGGGGVLAGFTVSNLSPRPTTSGQTRALVVGVGDPLIEGCLVRGGLAVVGSKSSPRVHLCEVSGVGVLFTHGTGGQFSDSEIKNCAVGVRVESGAEPTFRRCLVRETDIAVYVCAGGNPRLHGCDVIGELRIKGSGQFTQCNICSIQNQSGKDSECALEKLLQESKEKLATAAAREKKDAVVHAAAMSSLQSNLTAGNVHLNERQQTKGVDGSACDQSAIERIPPKQNPRGAPGPCCWTGGNHSQKKKHWTFNHLRTANRLVRPALSGVRALQADDDPLVCGDQQSNELIEHSVMRDWTMGLKEFETRELVIQKMFSKCQHLKLRPGI